MALSLPESLPTLPTVTGQLELRPFGPADVGPLAGILAQDAIWAQGYGDGEERPSTLAERTDFIRRRYFGLPVFSVFLEAQPGQSRFIGTTGVIDHHRETERVKVGRTVLDPEFWGAMVNHEMKIALLDWLFSCGAGRIECDVDPRNQRSLSSLTRFGFTIEGIRRRSSRRADGSWRDITILSLLVEEWPETRQRALSSLEAFRPRGSKVAA